MLIYILEVIRFYCEVYFQGSTIQKISNDLKITDRSQWTFKLLKSVHFHDRDIEDQWTSARISE